ncbi:MAG: 3-oxoacyl-[acyl-carrier-protein] reductase [Thermoleophilia bacterium]|nr:3-oxoacyl-[acyl-carrier-protein] reductase [Thermoleophilia bacterium]
MAERPLEGRVTLVTGGSRGIGAAISQQLAAAGAKVGVNYTANREAAEAVVSAITAAGGEAVAILGDVSDPEAAGAMVDATEEAFGDDLWNLVANAGITRDNLISRITPEDWDRVIDVNLGGTFHVARAASRKMLRKKRGSIVTMSSVVGVHGNLGQTNYAASKGGVIALTKALAKEVGSRGIRVNCVAPGYISTELTDVLNDEIRGVLLAQTPLGRLGEPDDIANTVRFLLSDDAAFVTGAILSVDGGLGM